MIISVVDSFEIPALLRWIDVSWKKFVCPFRAQSESKLSLEHPSVPVQFCRSRTTVSHQEIASSREKDRNVSRKETAGLDRLILRVSILHSTMDHHAVPSTSAAPHTGTTIVAVEYDGGVVLGADSRVSTGTYVSNRASDKITPLSESIYLLRSGSAADTQAVSDYVRYFAEQHEQQLQYSPDEPVKVHTVANLVKMMNYQNKHLVGAMIVAGWYVTFCIVISRIGWAVVIPFALFASCESFG